MKLVSTEFDYVDTAELFERVADQPWAILLDSGASPKQRPLSKNADVDVLAIRPKATLVFDGEVTHYRSGAVKEKLYGDPLAILQSAIPSIDTDLDVAYLPGAIGYFSYDLARQFENLPTLAQDDEALPMMAMGIYCVVVVVDHKQRTTKIVQIDSSEETNSLVKEWADLIQLSIDFERDMQDFETETDDDDRFQTGGLLSGLLVENMDRKAYRANFKRVRDYIVEGDCYQVNLTKQFSASVAGDAWLTYRYLRTESPAPYGAYMNLPFAQILSNSPESFIQCRDGKVATSPIKGTRPRAHHNKAVDKAEAMALHNSEKDRAENLMIVDLMRNDLSRCCEFDSVKVPKLFEIHSFANVHHMISTVTGQLRRGLHALDLLRSCFPGGSITGAPKIRAMEIIEELEPTRRGLYCGAIGYIGVDGSLETSIAIRTIVVKDGIARYSAGGGLVIDSKVESEYQELLDKARMMTEALFKNKRPPNL